MKTGREIIANIFGIETYEEKYRQKCLENEILAKRIAKLTISLENTKAELDFYKLSDEDKIKVLMKDANEAYEYFAKRGKECDELIDRMDRIEHRAFAQGRQAAYSEMGIWRLDAIEAGNRLVMDACGDVYELLELQDVKPEDTGKVEDDGIIIDDLTEIGA